MDRPSDYGHASGGGTRRKPRQSKTSQQPSQAPQLFQDTSIQQSVPYPAYNNPNYNDPSQSFGVPNFMADPMANMAVQYGSTFADQGKEYVHKNIEKYVSTSKIKYYFAVDTSYVARKLALITFPFTHSDWSIKYSRDEPVAPRYDINAPDLYIPVMAFVTYILVAGVSLGVQNKFSPEQLGVQASSVLVWLVVEVLAMLASLYLMNVSTDLKYLDIIAYSGYKYIGMIVCVLSSLSYKSWAYYGVLLWFSLCTSFFLIRTLRIQIQPHANSDGFSHGRKRSVYLILSFAFIQPLFMWWITRSIVPSPV